MDKFKETLNRKVGPFKVKIWLLILLGGAVVGLLLRLRNTDTEAVEGGEPVGVDGLPTLHGSNGAMGVPYPYLDDDRSAEERAADFLQEGLEILGESWMTQRYKTNMSVLGKLSIPNPFSVNLLSTRLLPLSVCKTEN
jgi:hypothetical protein